MMGGQLLLFGVKRKKNKVKMSSTKYTKKGYTEEEAAHFVN